MRNATSVSPWESLGVVGMPIDHDYYGHPVEYGFVRLTISQDVDWTPEMLAIARRDHERAVRAMAKRMPHRYWLATD